MYNCLGEIDYKWMFKVLIICVIIENFGLVLL